MNKFTFQIKNSELDIPRVLKYLETEERTSYTVFDPRFVGFEGIGLTSFSGSNLDALRIEQKVSMDRKVNEAMVNWQLMTERTKHVHGIVAELFDRLKFKPMRARFAIIHPRNVIKQHTDDYMEEMTRVHWPIITDEKNIMIGDGKRYHFSVGECHAINTNLPHGFVNGSDDCTRIHLIINFDVPFIELVKHAETGLFK